MDTRCDCWQACLRYYSWQWDYLPAQDSSLAHYLAAGYIFTHVFPFSWVTDRYEENLGCFYFLRDHAIQTGRVDWVHRLRHGRCRNQIFLFASYKPFAVCLYVLCPFYMHHLEPGFYFSTHFVPLSWRWSYGCCLVSDGEKCRSFQTKADSGWCQCLCPPLRLCSYAQGGFQYESRYLWVILIHLLNYDAL
jgi:hypothetical protein